MWPLDLWSGRQAPSRRLPGEGGLRALRVCAGRLRGQDGAGEALLPTAHPAMDGKGAKWLCESIPRIDRSEPIQHNCLEMDHITLSCSIAAAPIPPGFRHNYLALGALRYPHACFLTPALMVLEYLSFITSHLKPFLEGGGVLLF